MKKNVSRMLDSFLFMQRDLEQDNQWSLLDLGSDKSGILSVQIVHKENGTESQRKMTLEFGESRHPVFRATRSPLSRGQLKCKGGGKLSIHYCADQETISTVFRTNISVNQLSLQGAVAEMCEEYETFHDRTGQPVVGGQSISSFLTSVIKTKCLWTVMTLLAKIFYCNNLENELKKLSQQDRLSKFFKDAGFPIIVEIGQYFMIKHTAEFSQFTDAAARREYILPTDEEPSQPKGWIRVNTKIGPVLQVAICCLHGKLWS